MSKRDRARRRRDRIATAAIIIATLGMFAAALGFATWQDYTNQVGIFADR